MQSSTTQQKPKRKKKEIPAAAAAGDGKSHRICSYDYKAWDKFDAVRIYHKSPVFGEVIYTCLQFIHDIVYIGMA